MKLMEIIKLEPPTELMKIKARPYHNTVNQLKKYTDLQLQQLKKDAIATPGFKTDLKAINTEIEMRAMLLNIEKEVSKQDELFLTPKELSFKRMLPRPIHNIKRVK